MCEKKTSEPKSPCEPSARGPYARGDSFARPRMRSFRDRGCEGLCQWFAFARTPTRRVRAVRGWFCVCVCRSLPRTTTHVNDPSAGSPTDTLLRLLRPLPQIICPTSQPNDHGQADHGTHPYRSLTGTIGRSDGRCVQRAGTFSTRANDSRLLGSKPQVPLSVVPSRQFL